VGKETWKRKRRETKEKTLGKKKNRGKKEKEYTIPFFKLFSCVNSFEVLLMVVGIVGVM